jgi:hypothetical protein
MHRASDSPGLGAQNWQTLGEQGKWDSFLRGAVFIPCSLAYPLKDKCHYPLTSPKLVL